MIDAARLRLFSKTSYGDIMVGVMVAKGCKPSERVKKYGSGGYVGYSQVSLTHSYEVPNSYRVTACHQDVGVGITRSAG